jgi:hypothetical protein
LSAAKPIGNVAARTGSDGFRNAIKLARLRRAERERVKAGRRPFAATIFAERRDRPSRRTKGNRQAGTRE